jgi:hypothetical protein
MENGIRSWVWREPCQRTRVKAAHVVGSRPSASAKYHDINPVIGCDAYYSGDPRMASKVNNGFKFFITFR